MLRIGCFRGIKLKLNNWFLIVLLLFILAGLSSKITLLFSAVLWHELAHAIAAHIAGLKVREIELLPFGGVAKIDCLNEAGTRSEMFISFAGPAASLALAACCYLAIQMTITWQEVLLFYYYVNLVLAVFNLLPALPLDGGRALRAYLSSHYGYKKATAVTIKISKLVSAGLLFGAFLYYLYLNEINLTFIVSGIFIYVASRKEAIITGFRTMRILAGKKARLTSRGLMPTIHFTVIEQIPVQELIHNFGPNEYYVVLIVQQDKLKYRGMLTETEIWEQLPEKGLHVPIGHFL